jgi:hypothetical protein
MRFALRTVAFLLLLAGASVGFFAGTLFARDQGVDPSQIAPDEALDQKVHLYRAYYDLGPEQTESVRQTLRTHGRRIRDAIYQLRVENPGPFESIRAETEQRLREICVPRGSGN